MGLLRDEGKESKMSGYKHILLPTDFSEPSEAAAIRAMELAKACGAQLSVLTVVDYVPPGYIRVDIPEASAENLAARARAALSDWVKRLGISAAKQWVEVGPAKQEIIKVAKDNRIDLIVMGSHGERGLGRLLGSTANTVLHEAECDVLCVHPSV
jgi:universal stress protein A